MKLGRALRRLLHPNAILASLCLAGGIVAVGRVTSTTPSLDLIAGTNFTVTSTISSSSATETPDLLYPGAPRFLWYTVHNPLTVPITVNSLTATLDPDFAIPPACPASNLDMSAVNFTGSLVVPARVGSTDGTAAVAKPISLLNSASNQDGCKSVTFHFAYSGTATYTELFATSTALVSSQNPSIVGGPVTFTATVTPTGTPPSGPTGTVTFKDGATTLAANVTLVSGQATYMTSTLAIGSHSITAKYNPSTAPADVGNFSTSTGSLTQVVNSAATTTALTSSLNPSTFGQSVTFTATVTSAAGTPTGSVSFFDGATSLGSFTLNASGKAFLSTSTLTAGTHPIKAVYAGAGVFPASTSSVLNQVVNFTSCVNGTQGGGLTVANGQSICIGTSGRLNGDATVQNGGTLTVLGTVNGNVNVQSGGTLIVTGGTATSISATGAKGLTICGATVKGDLTASGGTGFVLVGAGTGCSANSISGNMNVTGNTAGFGVTGNAITKTLTVTNNVSAGSALDNAKIANNTIKGSLSCSGNSPAPVNGGSSNTVKGTRTGQCSAASF